MTRVGVVGAGLMGSGIAEVCARHGHDVTVVETSEEALAAGLERLERSLARGVERGKLTAGESAEARGRVTGAVDLDALADRELVIEAATENEAAKLEIFRRLDAVVDPDTVLASNTSAIPISRLGAATTRPERVVGLHFFNPAPVMELVEIIPALLTSPATLDRARDFATGLGKTCVVAPDRAGFVVNALLIPYLLAAIRMVESGTSAETVDTAMRLGCAHPLGPLALADLAGLDTVASAAEALHREHGEPLYAPPPLLRRMVESGLLGRKTGRGFHTYAG